MAGVTILLVAHWLTHDGASTAGSPCPSCVGQPLTNAGVISFGISWVLAIAAAGIMRFALFRSGPPLPRFGTMLILVGLVLLGAYGLGLIVLIPGVLMLASSTDEVAWLSLRSMVLIVVGAVGLIPLFLFVSGDLGEPWMSILYLPPLLLGVGWIRLGLDVRQRVNET